uniref:Uncharacterized protein n=1 Tax=Macrostomum lignano TaxID=282301 RepID=A0A1I8FMM9_9PLAT
MAAVLADQPLSAACRHHRLRGLPVRPHAPGRRRFLGAAASWQAMVLYSDRRLRLEPMGLLAGERSQRGMPIAHLERQSGSSTVCDWPIRNEFPRRQTNARIQWPQSAGSSLNCLKLRWLANHSRDVRGTPASHRKQLRKHFIKCSNHCQAVARHLLPYSD